MKPYWMVWGSGVPYYRHGTERAARQEAERLALANPGQEFVVVMAIASCKKTNVSWQEMGSDPFDDLPIPF